MYPNNTSLLCLIYRTKGNDIWLQITIAVIGKDVSPLFLLVKTVVYFVKQNLLIVYICTLTLGARA